MSQDTGKFRTNTKDQFYTKASVAKLCVNRIIEKCPEASRWKWIEPSAGNGVFLKILHPQIEKLGIDIEPADPSILRADFLTWLVPGGIGSEKKLLFFGNPPFGRQGSLAKAFIGRAAACGAECMAFILPRSFMKPSMTRAFPLKFHCIWSEALQKNAFEVNKEEYDVPAVFQIWQKMSEDRVIEKKVLEEGYVYVKAGQPFHLAFRRVGVYAGKCFMVGRRPYSAQSHYFLKFEERFLPHLTKIMDALSAHEFPSNTVGPRSLSKSEANLVINQKLLELLAHP